MEHDQLAERINRVIKGLRLSQVEAAADAKVAPDTIRAALRGGLKRGATIKQLHRWVEQAERRLERRGPR